MAHAGGVLLANGARCAAELPAGILSPRRDPPRLASSARASAQPSRAGFCASGLAGAKLRIASRAPGTPRAASPSGAVRCNLVQKLTAKELDELLGAEERKLPIVIDFYATWCGPCILLAQQLEQLAVEYHGQVQFVKVDTDEEYELANQLEIRGLPTVVFVSKDKAELATRTEGLLPLKSMKELIEGLCK